jgi:hypothetical protein
VSLLQLPQKLAWVTPQICPVVQVASEWQLPGTQLPDVLQMKPVPASP